MHVIIPTKIRKVIYSFVKKHSPREVKGALFAEHVSENKFIVDGVYIEPKVGNVAFVALSNNWRYKRFQRKYHLKHKHNYQKHNYIGDWHSHPSFALYPSNYDKKEVIADLKKSNAHFLLQIIVKVKDSKLIGNGFLYDDKNVALQIKLIID